MKGRTAEEGTEITLAANAFTRDGWTFSGWATSAGGNIAYDDNSGYTIGTADVTLYAVWGKLVTADNAATVIAGLEGGTDGAAIYYLLVTGTDVPTDEEFARSKQKYSEPLAITENAVVAAAAVKDGMKDSETATATFTVKTYTVTFETAHGTVPTKIEGLRKGDTLGDKLQELTAEGYRFDGWFDSETQFTAETEITSSLTLTTKWTKIYYNTMI